jgi:hypothetical protein
MGFFTNKRTRVWVLTAAAIAALADAASWAQQTTPYSCGFEPPDFTVGPLPQQGWFADPPTSASVQNAVFESGSAAIGIQPRAVVTQTFDTPTATTVWVDCFVRLLPSNELPDLTALTSGTALVELTAEGVYCLDGDGAGSGTWINTGISPEPDAWVRVTLAVDHSERQRYDCYIDGQWAAAGFGFLYRSEQTDRLNGMSVAANVGNTYLDEARVGLDVPPFLLRDEVWVDFAWDGLQWGTVDQPFKTLDKGVAWVRAGGVVKIKSGTSRVTPRLTRPARFEADGGPVRIGDLTWGV